MDKRLASLALGLLLAACGQQATPAASSTPYAQTPYAQRPELQDAGSQAILQRYGDDPGLAQALREAYHEAPRSLGLPDSPALTAQDLSSDRLAYVKSVGWGNVGYYDGQYGAYAVVGGPSPGLNWTRDGCSAPSGLGLGYTGDFRPACNVHDFGYRNLKVLERTDANRKTTDEAFYTNMKIICDAKPWYKEPPCFAAAYAYYQGVRINGGSSFQ